MRRQGSMLGMMAAAALLSAGMAPGVGGIPTAVASLSAPSGFGSGSALNSAFAGMSRRSMRFAGGGGNDGFGRPRYRKHPFDRTVAQDKRDARKRRNQLRNKR